MAKKSNRPVAGESWSGELEDPPSDLARPVGGLDEAGRGPLAGPVTAAVVIAPDGFVLEGLNDSKKLSARQRDRLAERIQTHPDLRWGLGWASPEEIDEINILQASFLAMRRALESLGADQPKSLVVDGNRLLPGWSGPQQAVVQGDGRVACIAAASILAKTARDARMAQLDQLHPGYGLAVHQGYPVPAHLRALRELGPSPVHRRSFGPVRELIECLALPLG